MRTWSLIAVLAVVGCSRNIQVDDTGLGDDTGSSTNDTGNDDTGETGTPVGDVDCEVNTGTPAPNGGAGADYCITAPTLVCGDSIVGTNAGGTAIADKEVYTLWTCNPGTIGTDADWTAPERFYEFFVPDGRQVEVKLYTDCGDLWLRAVRSNDECPVIYSKNCEVPVVNEQSEEQTVTLTNPAGGAGGDLRYEIVIDGLNGAVGNFKLEIDCN